MNVVPIPGLEHLPYAEVWLHAVDEGVLAEACRAAREIGKDGLEVWTTTRTPDVAAALTARGYEEVRRYTISELDVAAVPDPGPPAHTVVTLAERPELGERLYPLARVAHADQPGRAETRVSEAWFEWGLRAHPPEAYFVALEGADVLGYGYLEHEGDTWRNGFMAIDRAHRGKGVAGSIKRAQLRWAKANGIAKLETANEVRLAGMLDLNRRLGYVRIYDEIVLRGYCSL